MAWLLKSDTNEGLIQQLQDLSIIKTQAVADAMKKTDRKFYCRINDPFVDESENIGNFSTLSSPHIHAYILENLASIIRPDSKILDIGCGSGCLTACLARLIDAKAAEKNVEATGVVVAMDSHPKLIEFAIGNINLDGPTLIASGRVRVVQGDARTGCEDFAPYDIINVGTAVAEKPKELFLQLKIGGRVICPIGPEGKDQKIMQYDRVCSNEIHETELANDLFIPLKELK
ncbi:hypothetical protein PVAND_016361 [Polypedilum vanderplanki]|uniref:protein-L-isoaspartate(D-aspartate) O-methyltransferase n=1 Tax=Polypedilum vanderplanki TaxID=319348 RepID=S6BTJ9_POLVA|nr:hypothetical protein PVAND_016361 [Polypedilum vanderplanki]BAN67562.1 protein L-isoaspartyl methyltransferase [Polypedilum vanderplanki]